MRRDYEKVLFNLELKADNKSKITSDLGQIFGQNVGLLLQNSMIEKSATHSLFSALIRGVNFRFYRFEINQKYLDQICDPTKALNEELRVIRLHSEESLDFNGVEDRQKIVSILYNIQKEVTHSPPNTESREQKVNGQSVTTKGMVEPSDLDTDRTQIMTKAMQLMFVSTPPLSHQ